MTSPLLASRSVSAYHLRTASDTTADSGIFSISLPSGRKYTFLRVAFSALMAIRVVGRVAVRCVKPNFAGRAAFPWYGEHVHSMKETNPCLLQRWENENFLNFSSVNSRLDSMSNSEALASFGFFTTAQEVVEAFPGEATGRTAVVTGGGGGIGRETVRALVAAGCAHVVLCARNVAAGQAVADEVNRGSKADVVKVVLLDLADLESVKRAAEAIKDEHSGIDFLVLNAGVMMCPLMRTKQGLEMQFGTNHIGHFLFTKLLLERVVAAGTESQPSRVVSLSSIAHTLGRIRLDDLNYDNRWYESSTAYGQSKLANLLFARQLARRLARDGQGARVKVYSVHPGSIVTGLQRHSMGSYYFQKFIGMALRRLGGWQLSTKTVEEGASTTLVACLAPGLETGSYLVSCQVAKSSARGEDEAMMEALWEASEALVRDFL